jgi:tRNA threonylcarbamoyladenosine biosynthesis protein TsaB
MKILAIDTATEQCSAAIIDGDRRCSRLLPTLRGHADTILPMIDVLLTEAGYRLRDLDGIAFGRGPGSFTGVRIAISVAQGLGYGLGLPLVGISNLAAVAQQAANQYRFDVGTRIAVCMDARMMEVYWAVYRWGENGRVTLEGEERVTAPSALGGDANASEYAVGTGWQAHPNLAAQLGINATPVTMLPRATEIAELAAAEFAMGRGVAPSEVEPVYLRNNVVTVRET